MGKGSQTSRLGARQHRLGALRRLTEAFVPVFRSRHGDGIGSELIHVYMDYMLMYVHVPSTRQNCKYYRHS